MYTLFLATALSIAPAAPLNCAPGQQYDNCYCPQVNLNLPCPPGAIVPCFSVTPPMAPCPTFGSVCPPRPVRGPVVNTRPCPCPPQGFYCPHGVCPNRQCR